MIDYRPENGHQYMEHHHDMWVIYLRCPFPEPHDTICKWIKENIGDDWGHDPTGWRPSYSNGMNRYGYSEFCFTTKEDAMAFMMRWL